MREIGVWIVLTYLRYLAKLALLIHRPTVIGIAGSVGKSSTRNALFAVLNEYFPVKMVGNSETGIPLGILGITPSGFSKKNWVEMLLLAPRGIQYLKGTKYLIVEMGIDDPYPPKNMSYLLSIVKPHIAISLNIAATHTEQFEKILEEDGAPKNGTSEEKHEYLLRKMAEEDAKIITASGCKVGIYNKDDAYLKQVFSYWSNPATKILTFGEEKENTVSYIDHATTLEGTSYRFLYKAIKEEKAALTFKKLLLLKEYRELFAATFLAGKELGLSNFQITTALEKNFTLPKGRSSMFEGIGKSVIIDSSYNASKLSVLAFLTLLSDLSKKHKRPSALLLGDMRELGGEAEGEHREVAEKISETVEYLYCIGPLTLEHIIPYIDKKTNKVTKEIRWFSTAHDAGRYLKAYMPHKTILLVKGSQNTLYLEEAIKYLLENKEDEKKLCRQEPHWIKTKDTYFKTI